MLIFSEQGCGKYILIDSTARYNLAGEGCRKGYNGELVRIDSLSQQKYIQNWLNTLRRCFSKHIVFIMSIFSIFYIVLYAYCFYAFSELLHHCVCACGRACVRAWLWLVLSFQILEQFVITQWLFSAWSLHRNHTFWVGAKSRSIDNPPVMRWNCGWESVAGGYENWAAGEPNIPNGSDRCAFMKREYHFQWFPYKFSITYNWRTNDCEIPNEGKTPLAICHVCKCNGPEAERCCL